MLPPFGVVRGRRKLHHLSLKERLRRAREAAGLTRRALSLAAGLSDTAAAQIEEGRVPGIDTVEHLGRALQVAPCWLAYGHEGQRVFREKIPGGEPPDDVPEPAPACAAAAPMRCGEVGTRLRLARERAGLSLTALGRAAGAALDRPGGIARSAIGYIEQGRTMPSVETVEALALALQVSPCWLAYGEGDGPA